MKRITALVLALILALSLCACGSTADANEAMYGTYTLYAMDYDAENIILADGLFDGENYITLKSGGAAEICLESSPANVRWKADGEKLTFTAADGDMDGCLSDGVLILVADGSNLYFVADEAAKTKIRALTLNEILYGAVEDALPETAPAESAAPAEATPQQEASAQPAAPAVPETEVQKMWNGWWYGCADISGSEKGWEWANGKTFDAAMYVELGPDGAGTFGIFDPYGEMALGPNNNRYITIQCHADTRYLYGDSGTVFGYPINTSDWRIVHNLDNADKLNVGSSYTDDNGNKMGFDFTFLPWGDRWETENYSRFIPHFGDYLARLDEGWTDPYGGLDDPLGTGVHLNAGGGKKEDAASGGSGGSLSPLLGSSPARLDVNGKGAVYIYYPGDQFRYDDTYGKLKNDAAGVGILIDPMLGASNLSELKASYEEHNSDEADYSLTETTINGYKALVMTYSDWLGSTLRVDIAFGGNHDGFYGMSFAVSGDSLEDCDTELVWAIIQSMEVVK